MQLKAKILSKNPGYRDEDNPDADVSGLDPWQYAVPPEYGMDPQSLADESRSALNELPTQEQQAPSFEGSRSYQSRMNQNIDPERYEAIPGNPNYYYDKSHDQLTMPSGGPGKLIRKIVHFDPKSVPEDLPVSPAASGKTKTASAELSPETELSDQQLLRNYLLSLQKRRDTEGELRAMNETALDRGRTAMLAEGLSESASKMGNIMGTPTGSTMQGFGKEAANLEMTGVDQARKIMEGTDPTVELARQAQIATMLEQIRTSRGKAAEAEADRQVKREQIESQERQNRLRVEAQKQKPKPKAKLTEGELKSQDYANRMRQAEENISSITGQGYKPEEVGAALRGTNLPVIGRYFQNPEDRKYNSAKREWLLAKMRKDSGATVKEEEYRQEEEAYFPMPGDDAATIEQKRQSRLNIQKVMEAQGRGASQDFVPSQTPPAGAGAGGAASQPSPAQAPTQGKKMRGAVLKKYKSQGKVLMKDTMTGEYVAVKKSELQKYKTIPNPKQANQPRYMEVTE